MSRSGFSLISLFSGAGGMDLGFSLKNSFNLLFANDILEPPAQTYSFNFKHQIIDLKSLQEPITSGSAFLLGDIGILDFEKIDCCGADVVVGGPPCQDFSVVRGPEKERRGIYVKRGRLYSHFIRALIHLQPKAFVFENVPGLKSANSGSAYSAIIEDFSRLNLRWEEIRKIVGNSCIKHPANYQIIFSDIVDSACLGVPQRRKRLIIIGVRDDLIDHSLSALYSLKKKSEEVLLGKNTLLRKYPMTPLEVFEGKPLPELSDEYRSIMEEYKDVSSAVKTNTAEAWKRGVWDKLTLDIVRDYLSVNQIINSNSKELSSAFLEHEEVLKKLGYFKNRIEGKAFTDGSNIIPAEKEEVIQRLKVIPPDENHTFVKGTKWEVEGRGMSLIYRRIHPLKPSYTIVAYGGGGTWGYHYKKSRGKLTHRERARLQTFPDWFLFKGDSAEIRAQIGEAVPPLLGSKIAEVVEHILQTCKS